METRTTKDFDEAARFILHGPDFQKKIQQRILEEPDIDEHMILFLLIEEAQKLLQLDPQTEEGRKQTQRLVKKDLLRDIRRIFHLASNAPDKTVDVQQEIQQKIHHVLPLEEEKAPPERPEDVLIKPSPEKKVERGVEKIPEVISKKESPRTNPEVVSGPNKKLVEFITSLKRLTDRASEGDPKILWTNRFRKENISLEAESKSWKEHFDAFARVTLSQDFFNQHPGLKDLQEDTQRLQELASAVKARYNKSIAPIVVNKLGRENINPYKTPDYYKLTLEEVVNFMKGKKSVSEYLDGLFQVYKYTPAAVDKRNLSDILKK